MRKIVFLYLAVLAWFLIFIPPVPAQSEIKVLYKPKICSLVRNSFSQLVPASALTFSLPPDSFPGASPTRPVIIEIQLPPNARLSETLATGNLTTPVVVIPNLKQTAAIPRANVIPLVVEGQLKNLTPAAVQLLRYVKGEDKIWIRLCTSTLLWRPTPLAKGYFGYFSIGVGGNILPRDISTSNWHSVTKYIRWQPSTLFHFDLRSLPFKQPEFTVTFRAFYQFDKTKINAVFTPSSVNLFTWNREYVKFFRLSTVVSEAFTDYCLVDLNRDGLEDVVSINSTSLRLTWSFCAPGGGFTPMDWRDLAPVVPRTVEAADLDDDGWADIIVSDDQGNLHFFPWESMSEEEPTATKTARPSVSIMTAGIPADSVLADLDRDGRSEYVFTDLTDNTLKILSGTNFVNSQSYPAGNSPVALCASDFDGDNDVDLATANAGANSVSVFWNRRSDTGTFSLAGDTITGVNTKPVDIEAADFDRNGKLELAVALQDEMALGIYRIGGDGRFVSAQTPVYFYPDHPSAILADNFDGLDGPDVLVGFSDHHMLAFCKSSPAGSLALGGYLNTMADVEIDPDNDVILPEDEILAMADGTTYGGVSSRNGVAGLEKQPFNVLHFPRTRDISFAVVNYGAADALFNLELYNANGVLKGVKNINIPRMSQLAVDFMNSSVFGTNANDSRNWVRAFITREQTCGIWLIGTRSGLTTLDGAKIPGIREAKPRFVFPVIRGGTGFTTLSFINPSRHEAHAKISLVDASGTVNNTLPLLIAPRTRRNVDVLTASPQLEAYLLVESDRALIGHELFGDGERLSCLEGLAPGTGAIPLFTPHVAGGAFGAVEFLSLLSIVNTSPQAVKLAAYLHGDDGGLLASNLNVNLTAGGMILTDVHTLFNLPAGPVTGYVKIVPSAGASGIAGSVSLGEAGAGRFETALPMMAETHPRFVMGHIASGRIGAVDYFTGLAILNPAAQPQQVNISVHDSQGGQWAFQSFTLQAGQRTVFLFDQFFPGLGPFFGGFLTITVNEGQPGLMVFQLFGDHALNFLSAVQAIPME